MDEQESSEMETEYQCVEHNVSDLLNKLKIEYDKLIKLQSVRNKEKLSITYNRNKLKMWDDFEALWVYWDIKSFVEWLKRIKYQYVKSFMDIGKQSNNALIKLKIIYNQIHKDLVLYIMKIKMIHFLNIMI